jgi:hypothetical protein
MVLIKRVMIAAAMSLLSEGAIAGVMPETPSDKTLSAQQAQGEPTAAPVDAARPETR